MLSTDSGSRVFVFTAEDWVTRKDEEFRAVMGRKAIVRSNNALILDNVERPLSVLFFDPQGQILRVDHKQVERKGHLVIIAKPFAGRASIICL